LIWFDFEEIGTFLEGGLATDARGSETDLARLRIFLSSLASLLKSWKPKVLECKPLR
jgi:hypothetical protein